ncbi:MAG: MBL fold metallo-hydrolase [Pseudomonadota bacterium]
MEVFDGLHAFMWDSMIANNCNTYLIDGSVRVLIDPGHEAHFDHVVKGLDAVGLQVSDIDLVICTHCHPDHLEGAGRFKNERAQVTLHEAEWQFLTGMAGRRWGAMVAPPDGIIPAFFMREGPLNLEGLELEVFHTPGHSPGSVCLYWPDKKVLFSGDLIFAEGLGRVDLPGGEGNLLKESIRCMKELDTRWIMPGHGEYVFGENDVRQTFWNLETVWFQYI